VRYFETSVISNPSESTTAQKTRILNISAVKSSNPNLLLSSVLVFAACLKAWFDGAQVLAPALHRCQCFAVLIRVT